MRATEILDAAQAAMERQAKLRDRPDGERSMPRIVRTFNAMTGLALTETEGHMFLVCLKAVRLVTCPSDADSAADGAAYFAMAGEAL